MALFSLVCSFVCPALVTFKFPTYFPPFPSPPATNQIRSFSNMLLLHVRPDIFANLKIPTNNHRILHRKCNKSDSTCMCTVSLAFPQVSSPSLWLPSGSSVHTQQIGIHLLLDWSSRFFAGVFLQYVCVCVRCDFFSHKLAVL